MRIAGETQSQRTRLEEIKAQRRYPSDHELLIAALLALTGGPEKTQPLPLSAECPDIEPSPLADEVRIMWNRLTTAPIPRSTRLTEPLRKKIMLRLKTFKLPVLEKVFAEIERTPWCRGEGQRSWLIELRWVMSSDEHVQKFLDLALSRKTPSAGVVGCRHQPPCSDQASCTEKFLKEMR